MSMRDSFLGRWLIIYPFLTLVFFLGVLGTIAALLTLGPFGLPAVVVPIWAFGKMMEINKYLEEKKRALRLQR